MGKRLEKAPHKMDTQMANKHMKWYPILTVIEEIQLTNTVQYIDTYHNCYHVKEKKSGVEEDVNNQNL